MAKKVIEMPSEEFHKIIKTKNKSVNEINKTDKNQSSISKSPQM